MSVSTSNFVLIAQIKNTNPFFIYAKVFGYTESRMVSSLASTIMSLAAAYDFFSIILSSNVAASLPISKAG
jgi:hypothetical protein